MATKNESSCIRNDSKRRKSVNILILGDSGIGKSTLIRTYLGTTDIPRTERTIFKRYHISFKYNGNNVDLGLIDLDPGSNSPERRKCYPTDVDAIFLCFSIGDYITLKSVCNLWIHEVRAHFGKLVPVFLVGLKSDLRLRIPFIFSFSQFHIEENRLVEKCEAEVIHKNYYFHGDYMECTMFNVSSGIFVIQRAFLITMQD